VYTSNHNRAWEQAVRVEGVGAVHLAGDFSSVTAARNFGHPFDMDKLQERNPGLRKARQATASLSAAPILFS